MITTLFFYIQRLNQLTFFRQTLFGLSWMLATIVLALEQNPTIHTSVLTWFYLFLAFFSARSAGMCLNRLIDRYIDAQNPRTRERPLPKGEISIEFATIQVVVFLLLFFFAALSLGIRCLLLSSIVGVLLCAYSYMKRYTVLCHFGLGLVHMLLPITCWAAFTGQFAIEPVLLGLSLFCSIAASDILYACQDVAFDRAHRLKSIPAWCGISRAVDLAKCLHFLAVVFLLTLSLFYSDLIVATAGVAVIYWLCYKRLSKMGYEKSFMFTNTYSGLLFFFILFTKYFLCHVL